MRNSGEFKSRNTWNNRNKSRTDNELRITTNSMRSNLEVKIDNKGIKVPRDSEETMIKF